ncbi:toprim domain-containing protein [Haliea sp. E1-2-M8]|uniref:toprim domain-containing protein n=1 Tax=Haliea sp. E1-2-M8 TaxID=3064706 RepID=UPI00271FCE4B|nr:toprim domain-containing protein [Haliea sp. E1-2-M8]MDO8862308.1 toprim domain-containing protein [Haliea sp. E1-2-M8]
MNLKAGAPAQGANQYSQGHFTTTTDPVRAFAGAIAQNMGATVDPIPDSKIYRFDCPDGKRGNRACWYVLYLDIRPAGAYGNWRTGATFTWRQDLRQQLDPAEQARIQASFRAARAQRDQERIDAHQKTAERASALWRDGRRATVDHPYLVSKRIPALCLRQRGDVLLVSMRTVAGELVNIQRIHPDGSKRFLKGGRITGCFALFGRELPEAGELYIAEGWATAATIATTLRLPVVAAMNAGNLKSVAQVIRAVRPRLALVVAADNDHKTPGNPGMTAGAEAARLVQGSLTWPSCCMAPDCTCTDFNDTAHCGRAPR